MNMFDMNEDILYSFSLKDDNEFKTFDDFADYFENLNNNFLNDISTQNTVKSSSKKIVKNNDENKVILSDRKKWEYIDDPELRRKIRNRYSAERCRKRKIEQTKEALDLKEKAEKRVKLLEEEICQLRNILGEEANNIPTNL